jgi:kynureninase
LELIEKASFSAMRAKGIELTNTLESILQSSPFYRASSSSTSSSHPEMDKSDQEVGFRIITPPAPWRGTQLSLFILGPEGIMPRVFERCLKRGLVGDERNPNVIRLSPVVLYNTYEEVGRAAEILNEALREEQARGKGEGIQGETKEDVLGDA